MKKFRNIIVTTGDHDGIGFEVSCKALIRRKSQLKKKQSGTRIILCRSSLKNRVSEKLAASLSLNYKIFSVDSVSNALSLASELGDRPGIIEVVSDASPAQWVEDAARACLSGEAAAMVTAPLSKQSIRNAGFSDLGHTDILKRVCKVQTSFMGFIGKYFNVVLLTGHIPVSSVEFVITDHLIDQAIVAIVQLNNVTKSRKPLGFVGLNPHAGDDGLIGGFDSSTLKAKIYALQSLGHKIVGPLVPDACFQKNNWGKYSTYLCCYHDQGLIPFKLAHGQDSGVHVSLGLPIIRTSVDHGTAKDIFGKNRANPNSMIEALDLAIRLSENRKRG